MWTYLAILASISLLIGVFVRRVVLFVKKGKSSEKKVVEEESFSEKSEQKLSSEDRGKVAEWHKRAESNLKVGKEDEAIKAFVQALAIDEFHLETQHKLALLYMRKQMYGAAAALFKKLGELTSDAVHYSHLGLAMYNQNLFKEAKDAYQKAVDLDPSRPQRFASLAQVYRSLGELQNASIALNKALEIEKENLDFLFFLADIQAELGNLEEAKEVVKKILELEPENEEAMEHLKTFRKMEREEQ